MKIRKSTILPMLTIIERFNKGDDIEHDLRELLEHEDYQVQFEFFQNHSANIGFTKEEYIEFFKKIRTIKKEDIKSKALQYRIKDMLYIMDHVDHYRMVYTKLEHINQDTLKDAEIKAKLGLPDDVELGNVHLIFAIGLGVTGGFSYKHYTYYDLKVTVDHKSVQGILNTISHELHHRGFKQIERTKPNGQTLDATFLHFFSGEGLAVKYGNNIKGVLTTKLYRDEEMTINERSYHYYIEHFDSIYNTFIKDLKDIQNSKIHNVEELESLFMDHYYYRDVIIDGELHEFYLKNPIAYYFGADLWGLIHDIYGRETVFKLIKDPKLFLGYYNKALLTIGRNDLLIK